MSYADAVVKKGNKGGVPRKAGSKSPGKGAKAVVGPEGKLVDPNTGEELTPTQIATIEQEYGEEEAANDFNLNDFESEEEPVAASESSTDEEENLYTNCLGPIPNTRETGIQTSENHFLKIKRRRENRMAILTKAFNTDYALSVLYDDLIQQKKPTFSHERKEDVGMQVELEQIWQAVNGKKLTQIECEYNIRLLKG